MKGNSRLLAGAAIAAFVLLTALASAPAISGRTPFFTRGEPREALVVQTIVRGEGFILPMRNGTELPSKPPLFHWLGALTSVAQGHVSESAIRLPGLIAALMTVAASAAAAWMWWGPAAGALTAVLLGTSFQWLASSVSARVDMLLAATVTLALLLFARAIETGRRIPAVAYALLTAATLTKGPVGLILPCTIALLTLALRGELRFVGWRDLRLLGLATAAAGLWYVAAFVVGGDEFFAKQILKENVFRVLDPDSVEAGHVEPFWFYIPLLAAGLAPWSLFIPGLALFAVAKPPPPQGTSDLRGAHTETAFAAASALGEVSAGDLIELSAASSGDAGSDRFDGDAHEQAPLPVVDHGRVQRYDPHTVFVLVWAIVPFVLFSLAGSKRAVYLLPAYPACAMLLAGEWTRVMQRRPGPVASVALVAGAALSAALLVLTAGIVLAGSIGLPLDGWLRGLVSNADANNVAPMLEATREHRVVVIPGCIVLLAAAWMTIHAAGRGRWPRVVAATAVAMLALSVMVSTTLLPAMASKRSTRSLLVHVQQLVPLESSLSFYRSFDYGAVFYRGASIPVRQTLADVPEIDGAWLLTWPALLPALADEVRKLDTGGEAAGAYEVEEAIASEDVDPSDRSSLVLVRIVRRIGDERSDGK